MQRILIASDFDGTLSNIVERASEAVFDPRARAALAKLAGHQPRIQLAFLSGRSAEDLTTRIGPLVTNAIIAGNHGLEIRGCGMDWTHPVIEEAGCLLTELKGRLEEMIAGIPGAEVEDKGASLTLHYRRVEDSFLPEVRRLIESVTLPESIRIHEGKMVYEFRPAVEWNKGQALRRIISHLTLPDDAVIFLGDDVTDEDAFRILGEKAITVHIGSDDKVSLARFNGDDPGDAALFLEALAAGLSEIRENGR